MKNILENFWLKKIDLYSYCKTNTSETEELEKYIERHTGNLIATMTEGQKLTFEKYQDCYNELVEINERHIFTQAFRFGAQMVICILDKED